MEASYTPSAWSIQMSNISKNKNISVQSIAVDFEIYQIYQT